MPKAKTPRTNGKSKAVSITPENNPVSLAEVSGNQEVKRFSVPIPINVEEEIRRRAYELYEERGRTPGHDHEDWLVAEREVRARYQPQSA